MKKFSRIQILIAAMALAIGCSKGLHVDKDDAWVHDESLPVPVMFSSPQVDVVTKSTFLGPLNDLNNLTIGILGLETTTATDWSQSPDLLFDEQKELATDGSLVFDPPKYYPMSNTGDYSFYAYYCRGNKAKLSDDGSEYVVSCNYVGYTDLLWGYAEAEEYNGIKGYNAKYIRAITKELPEEYEEKLPKLEFYHTLTALAFKVRAEEGAGDVSKIQVHKLTLKDVHRNVEMVVAKKYSTSTSDTYKNVIRLPSEDKQLIGNIDLRKDANGDDVGTNVLDKSIPSTAESLGYGFMVYAKGITSFKGELYLKIDNVVQNTPIELEFKAPTEDGFQPGIRYTYTILIKDAQKLTISTNLNGWVDYDGSEDSFTLDPTD